MERNTGLTKVAIVVGIYLALCMNSLVNAAVESKDEFELLLKEGVDSFAELSGARRVEYETDINGCLISEGHWVVEDVRGQSGEYCISGDTLEPLALGDSKPAKTMIPDAKTLMLRYQWISRLFSHENELYNGPMDAFKNISEINALYNEESMRLRNDPHLAVYWLLHFGLLFDPRFDELNDVLSDSDSDLVLSAREFVQALTADRNFALNGNNPDLFIQRRANAIYAVSHQRPDTLKQLLSSWIVDNKSIGCAQAYTMVENAKQSGMQSWLLRQLNSIEGEQVGLAYIKLMLGNNGKKRKKILYEDTLSELQAYHGRWSNCSYAKEILLNIVDKAPVEPLEEVVDLYYGSNSLDANYFSLKRTIEGRGGRGLVDNRFSDVDLSEVDRVLSINYYNGGHSKFAHEFAMLDVVSKEAVLQKARNRDIKIDEKRVFKILWKDRSGNSDQLLTKFIAYYDALGEENLVSVVGGSDPLDIRNFLEQQRIFLIKLFKSPISKLQRQLPLLDVNDIVELKSDVLLALSFFTADSEITQSIFEFLADKDGDFAIKKQVYKHYLKVYGAEFIAFVDEMKSESLGLMHKGMMHQVGALSLSDDEKTKLTELIYNTLADEGSARYEYLINDFFQILQSMDTQAGYNAAVELVLNVGHTKKLTVDKTFTRTVYDTLAITKSMHQLENYSAFLAEPAFEVNTSLEKIALMSELLSWNIKLKNLEGGELLVLHNALLLGIEQGLKLGVYSDLPSAFKMVKKIENRIRKLDKKNQGSVLTASAQGSYSPIEPYFSNSDLQEQFIALKKGAIRKRLLTAKQSPPKSLRTVNDDNLKMLSGKHLNKRLWESEKSVLFVDQDNVLQSYSIEGGTLPDFSSVSFMRKHREFIPLSDSEWRRDTELWVDEDGDVVEWIWLGTSRLLLFASNTIAGASEKNNCNINIQYCVSDYGSTLENLEDLPIDSPYINSGIFDLSVRFANILEFDSASSASSFYSSLNQYKPQNYRVLDNWYFKGKGQLSRQYQSNYFTSFNQDLSHTTSNFYYQEPQEEILTELLKNEHKTFKNGIDWLSYNIIGASQPSIEDAQLSDVFAPFFYIKEPQSDTMLDWIRGFQKLEEVLGYGGVHALYPELNTMRLKIRPPTGLATLARLEDKTGYIIPKKLRVAWQESEGISLTQENGLDFIYYGPDEVLDATLPDRQWLVEELATLDATERDQARSFFERSWLLMRVREPSLDERYYFYNPDQQLVLMFKKSSSLVHADELFNIDEFSPTDVHIRVAKSLERIPLKAKPLVENEQHFLIGDENEEGDNHYVNFLADLANNVLTLESNVSLFNDDSMVFRYPTRDTLLNDRSILVRNFEALGMVKSNKPQTVN